jgi:hypothetical protein
MSINEIQDPQPQAQVVEKTERIVRENPVPSILSAIAVGFAIGLLARSLRPEPHPVRDYLDETSDYLRSLLNPVGKRARRAYESSSEAVRDAVDQMQDVDMGPVRSFWKRLFS